MLGGVGGITQQHRSRPFWSFLFFKRGCRCFQIALYLRRVDLCCICILLWCPCDASTFRCICILLQCPCDASILLKILCKLSITTANEIELPPPMCFLICTTFMFLVHGFFHQTGAIKTRTFTCIHVYYMS